MKVFLRILLIILILILIKLVITFTVNEVVIAEYNQNHYQMDLINFLKATNINQPYIVYYNEGNIFYQKGKYSKAISDYETALTKNPPLKKKCDIRVNLSIALVQNINATNKQEILEKLKEARENLYNDHCADPEDNSGRSQEAEALEEAIKELEEKVEKGDDSQSQGGDDGDDQEDDEETKQEQTIEQQLEEINKDANASRQSQMDDYKNLSNYEYYSGKSW